MLYKFKGVCKYKHIWVICKACEETEKILPAVKES